MTRTEKYKLKRLELEYESIMNFYEHWCIRANVKKIKTEGGYRH